MANKRRRRGSLCLSELLDEEKRKRSAKRRRERPASAEGFVPIDKKGDDFIFPVHDRCNAFSSLVFGRNSSKLDVFLRMMKPDFVEKVWEARVAGNEKILLHNGGRSRMRISTKTIFLYLAFRVRIQGLYDKPHENKRNPNALRNAF